MCWKTIVEVAKILPDDATITQADNTAAVEAARAFGCLVQSGCISFDLDGNLVENWDKNDKGNRNKMKEPSEDRHKRKLDANHVSAADISISISLSLHAEMTTSNWVQGPICRLRLHQAILARVAEIL